MQADNEHGNGAVEAVNKALVLMGQDVVVETLDTATNCPVTRKCATLYDDIRKRVLRDHAWGFARRDLHVRSACKGRHDGALRYVAAVPPYALRILACFDELGESVPYEVRGEVIRSRTNIETVAYIEDIDDLETWDAGAYQALVQRLCADLAKPVTGRINEAQLQEQKYQQILAEAKKHDAENDNLDGMAWGEGSYLEDAMLGHHDLPSKFGGRDGREQFAR